MVLGAIYALLGAHPIYAQLLNCGIAVATAALVYDTTRRLWDDSTARWALWLFALAPAQILMTGVLATEAPYGLVLMFALWLAVRLDSGRLAYALAIGALLAISNYVRATSTALIPAVAALPFVAAIRLRAATAWAAVLVVTFLIVLIPVAVWNEQKQGELSISPSNYGGWSLLTGTDPKNNGQYDADLIAVVGGTPGTAAFDQRAGQLAIERLRAKPAQFIGLAIKKFPFMWAMDDYGVSYTFGTEDPTNPDASAALLLVSQAAYLAIVGLALLGLWRIRSDMQPVVVASLLILATLVVVHSFLEIEPRYHSYVVPIFCILAGPGAASLRVPRRWTRRGQVELTN
jgi:4-amino-4-deoxy-L-arabinose transferase-like glycosyltransferase